MSLQADCGSGGGRGRGRSARHGAFTPKTYKSPIVEIAYATFNTGASKQAYSPVQQGKKENTRDKGFLVAQIIHTGTEQTIGMPAAVDGNDPDTVIIRTKEV